MEKKFQIRKNRMFLEEGETIFVTKEMIRKFSLLQKKSLEEEEYEALIRYRIQLSAYSWLSKQDYSEKALEMKLYRSYAHKTWIRELLRKLKEQGYLDDKNFALQWIASKKYSKKKMEYILFQKGLSEDVIREALKEAYQDPTAEIQRIWDKLGSKEKEKKIIALLRKGYNYSEIQKAISEKE